MAFNLKYTYVQLHNQKLNFQIFQEFVRKSEMAPFSPADYSGFWRYLTVRESSYNGDLMLIIAMHPQVCLHIVILAYPCI